MSEVNLELIARQIHLTLNAELDTFIDQVSSEMNSQDLSYYTQINKPVPVTVVPYPAEYVVGHDPQLLERPIESFPVVEIMAHHQSSAGGGDNYDTIQHECFIEAFVVADDTELVSRIAWRYAKAIHRVLKTFQNLNMNIDPIDSEPDVDLTNTFTKRKASNDNTTVYVQGVRFDFQVKQHQQVTNTQSAW